MTAWYHCSRVLLMESAIESLPQTVIELLSAPQTLIHNDCNPRNLCLRNNPPEESLKHTQADKSSAVPYQDSRMVCMFDWELATIDVPQRDLVEFLAFCVLPSASSQERLELIEFYRQHLEFYSGVKYPSDRQVICACEGYNVWLGKFVPPQFGQRTRISMPIAIESKQSNAKNP